MNNDANINNHNSLIKPHHYLKHQGSNDENRHFITTLTMVAKRSIK